MAPPSGQAQPQLTSLLDGAADAKFNRRERLEVVEVLPLAPGKVPWAVEACPDYCRRLHWQGKIVYPSVSSDDRRIAFFRLADEGDSHLFVIDLDGRNLAQVTRTRGEQNILPHWASDGGWTLSEVGTFGRPTSPRWSSAPGSQWDHATRSASK